MSDQSKNPPRFSSKKDYQTYKLELETWTKVTKHEKKNWGKSWVEKNILETF